MVSPAIKERIEGTFPNLTQNGYEITSPPNPRYNCIAWAGNDDSSWWEPITGPGIYWPPTAPMVATLDAYVAAYAAQGYSQCADASLESGFEKIAIFMKASVPSHAARQLETGAWTSKLGQYFDIQHNSLAGVERNEYGYIAQILKRPKTQG